MKATFPVCLSLPVPITFCYRKIFHKAWRDNTGHEVDVIIEKTNELYPIEIKSGKTVISDFFTGLNFWHKISGQPKGAVVYGGDVYPKRSDGMEIIPWNKLEDIISRLSSVEG